MKRIFIVLLSALVLSSCTLEEKVVSASMPENYYQTVPQIITGLNGCYIPLKSIYGSANYFAHTEVATDLYYYNRSDKRDSTSNFSPVDPQYGDNLWNSSYQGVMRCNAIYAAIERAPLTDEEKAPLFAECVILRAFYYYILTNNFGNVPFYLDEVTDKNNYEITHLPRMSAEDTRNAMVDELYYWLIDQEALPLIRTYDSPDHRIGAAVGCYLGGKLAMWTKRWAEAIKFFGVIEDIYGNGAGAPEGSLNGKYPLSDIPFGKKYVGESILESSNTYNEYGYQVTHTLASVVTPSRSTVVTEGSEENDDEYADERTGDYYAGVGIPEMGDQQRTTSPYRPSALVYHNKFTGGDGVVYEKKNLFTYANTTVDRRCAYYNMDGTVVNNGDNAGTLAWRWVGYDKTEDRTTTEPSIKWFSGLDAATDRPYLGNKFWCFGMIYTYDSNNHKIFRYAGALLCLAECHLRRGDMDLACAYLNEVKNRAGIKTVSAGDHTEDTLLAEIQDECARELFGEFNRRHDLIRWGIWYDRVMKFGGPVLRTNVQNYPCREYYPIADEQVALTGGILDNDEYAKYGL